MSDPSPPVEKPEQIVARLERELEAARAERDKAIAARDALIREVLPLSPGPVEARRGGPRPVAVVLALVCVGVVAGLLLQNFRALQNLQSSQDAGGRAGRRSRAATAAPPAAIAPRGRSWDAIPIPELELLGRAALSRDGRVLAIAEAGPEARVARLELATGRSSTFRARKLIRDLAFTLDGRSIACGFADGRVALFDAVSGMQQRLIRGPGTPVWSVAMGPGQIAVAGEGSTIDIYPLRSGAPRRLAGGHQGWVRALAFDQRGELLASGGHDGQVVLWNLRDGSRRALRAHRVWVSALALSPDGRRLASADWDGRIILWDARTGEKLRTLRGHVRAITALAFDPAGRQLASGSLDRTVALWDLDRDRPRYHLEASRWAVTWVGFAPRRQLLSVGGDGVVRRWSLPIALPAAARALPAAGAGEVTFRNNTTGERLRLRLIDGEERPLPGAAARLGAFLRCGADDRSGSVDENLVRLIDRIAEHFGRDHEIQVISGYRSPEYNHLRTVQSRGVAKESQHMAGTAIDMRVAGITITRLRDVVKSWHAGGVGFYPDSQFVHVDVGPVRSWTGQ